MTASRPSSLEGLRGTTIALVIPEQRKFAKVRESIQYVANQCQARIIPVSFEKLTFGEAASLNSFYHAHVAIADLTIPEHRQAMFFHLGGREKSGPPNNIILLRNDDAESTSTMQLASASYTFIPYQLDGGEVRCCARNQGNKLSDELFSTIYSLKDAVRDKDKELFLQRLEEAGAVKGEGVQRQVIDELRLELESNHRLCSPDVIISFLLCYRDLQDYDAMIRLMDTLTEHSRLSSGPAQQHLAFALNRRKQPGDRERAIEVLKKLLARPENHNPDSLCLYGRVYKDKFVESNYTDNEALALAVEWYRKGFKVQPNVYAGVNWATMMVVSGEQISSSKDMQHVCMILNMLIGRQGPPEGLTEYWDLATYFEVQVLAENFHKACQAAELMFQMRPPIWHLNSTLGNISLITRARLLREEEEDTVDLQKFDFWLAFFQKVVSPALDNIKIPVLSIEDHRKSLNDPEKPAIVPSYMSINETGAEDTGEAFVHLWYAFDEEHLEVMNDFTFSSATIKHVFVNERDERYVSLFASGYYQDFQLCFPSKEMRDCALQRIWEIGGSFEALTKKPSNAIEVEYSYENDERILLGSGTYGRVYRGWEVQSNQCVAIKEVPLKKHEQVENLHAEIQLHSHFHHPNIVRYYGSVTDEANEVLKIYMEFIIGGSLATLMKKLWGPIVEMGVIANYTNQILEGLHYLHQHQVVHRDIKGDNVLVDSFTGILKISDFGTTKRLSQVNPKVDAFKGTMQFMAPEVIDSGQRGYGPKADIWSLGCTMIEMATNKPPFMEFGSAQAAVFHVGSTKQGPPIPDFVTPDCKAFMERCFAPTAEERPSTKELRNDPFLLRAEDMPAGYTVRRSNSEPSQVMDAMKLGVRDKSKTATSPAHLSVSMAAEAKQAAAATATATAAAAAAAAAEFHGSVEPPVETARREDTNDLRRQKFLSILDSDSIRICMAWQQKLVQHVESFHSECDLSLAVLSELFAIMQAYMGNDDVQAYTAALESMFSSIAEREHEVKALHVALQLYIPQINESLREHRIKPHWTFYLDTLMSSAVKLAVAALQPILERHRPVLQRYQSQPGPQLSRTWSSPSRGTAASGSLGRTTSTSSRTSVPLSPSLLQVDPSLTSRDRRDYTRVMDEIKELHAAVQGCLTVQRESSQLMASLHGCEVRHVCGGAAGHSTAGDSSEVTHDYALDAEIAAWLTELKVGRDVMLAFEKHEVMYQDLMEYVTVDDLRSMGLRVGPRYKIWRVLQAQRTSRDI